MTIDLSNRDELEALYFGALLGISNDPSLLTPEWARSIQSFLNYIEKKELDPLDLEDDEREALKKKLQNNALKFKEFTEHGNTG